jgi:two-component system phosphate regulon sensor histidine kinase PhoR
MRPRILLVEDDRSVAYMLAMALTGANFEVEHARDGEAAWAAFQDQRPDVVLSDIRMPNMDGVELLRKIKAADPDLDVILLTGHGDLETAIRAVELGAYRYLEKPVGQMTDLIQTLNEAWQKRRLLRDRQLIDRISQDLSSRLSLEDLMGRFLEQVTEAFPQIDVALLSFYEPGDDQLTVQHFHARRAGCPSLVGARISAALSTSARAVDRLEPIWHDLSKVTLRPPEELIASGVPPSIVELAHAHPTMGTLGIPIVSKDAPVGALTLVNFQSVGALDRHMADLLGILCRQVGLYLRNVKLLAERETEASRLQAVLNSTADGLLVVDPAGEVIISNPRYRALLSPAGRLDTKAQKQLILMLQLCLQAEERANFVISLKHPASDEPTLLEVYGARVRQDGDIVAMVASLRDVTVIRSREHKRADLLRLARHEIGTPLETITLQVRNLLSSGAVTDETDRENLRWIAHQAREVETMITETLSYSDVKELLLTRDQMRLDLSHLANDLAEEAERLAVRRNLHFEADVAPDLWVMGTYTPLKQALRNLLDNARKFTPPGGAVSLRVWLEGTTIRVEVKDSGVGIPADEIDQIFEPYYRASSGRKVAGTGLGLSIVRDVISAHRGKIEVTSTLGQGSTFTVTLVAITPSK